MPPIVAVVLAALCFSTTGTAQALADVDASPLSVGAARILVGGGILGLVALVRLRGRAHVPDTTPRPGAHTWVVVLLGAAGVLAYQPTFFAGTRLNGVAIGTVVALGSAPIVTGILDALLRRHVPSTRWFVSTAIALTGVALVSGLVGTGHGLGDATPAGLSASLAAGASYAVYTVASKLLLDRSWSGSATMGAIFGVAAVLSVPLVLATPTAWIATPAGAALVLWLGVVTTALAYLLFGWGLGRLSPTSVSTLTLVEPLGATLLGVVVLREELPAVAVVGLVVIVVGLVLLGLPVHGRSRAVATPV